MFDFLDNNVIQGSGHLAQAYANLTLRKDVPGAYTELVTALAQFRNSTAITELLTAVEKKAVELKNGNVSVKNGTKPE